MLKYLRIAVTALSLTACVLLIALWVRSYSSMDVLFTKITTRRVITVVSSQATLGITDAVRGTPPNDRWKLVSIPASTVTFRYDSRFGVDAASTFSFVQRTSDSRVNVPFWLPVISFALFAALPWMRLQYSLRTLLIATTLVAVVLGVVVMSN